METPDYPPNSFSSKEPPKQADEKKIERVTSSEPVRRKKSLGRKFKDVVFTGNARSAGQYMYYTVFIPWVQDVIMEMGREGLARLIKGDAYRPRRGTPYSGDRGYVDYTRRFAPRPGPDPRQEMPRALSPRARSRHDFDEIVLDSRPEAEEVISQMFEIVSRYDTATVADLYELVGIRPSHVDQKWGWSDMRGAGVARTRDGGYLLELPDVQPMAM